MKLCHLPDLMTQLFFETGELLVLDGERFNTCPGLFTRVCFLAISTFVWNTSLAFSRIFAQTSSRILTGTFSSPVVEHYDIVKTTYLVPKFSFMLLKAGLKCDSKY